MTLVPLVMYFNHRGLVKLKIGIAKGKKNWRQARDPGQARLGPPESAGLLKEHG
jgi:SsrA-binding protein